MAKVRAGPAPWTQGFKALRKDATSRGHVPGKGWRKSDGYDSWKDMPKRTATKRIVNPLTGRSVNVPTTDMQDYWNAYISYTQTGSPDDDVLRFTAEKGLDVEAGMAAYAEEAFDDKHSHYVIEGCGHIVLLEYNTRRQVMRVTFRGKESGGSGGATVVYFRIPSALFGELYAHAQSKKETTNSFDGKSRHVLGIRFWDLVRIRGTRTGSRYRFTYVTDNAPGTGSPGRKKKYGVVVQTKIRKDGSAVRVKHRYKLENGTEEPAANDIFADSYYSFGANADEWKSWADDEFDGLFDTDAEPNWKSLPRGKQHGTDKEQQEWRLHQMYIKSNDEQKRAIQDAVRMFLNAEDNETIGQTLAHYKVRAPEIPESHLN